MQLTITLPDNVVPRIAASHENGLDAAIYTAIKVYCSLGPTTLAQIADLQAPGALIPTLPDTPQNITPTAVLREAVNRLHAQLLAVTPLQDANEHFQVRQPVRQPKIYPRRPPGRPPLIELQDRDRAIIHRHNAGASYQQIADEFILSVARVGQIISRERRKAQQAARAANPNPAI